MVLNVRSSILAKSALTGKILAARPWQIADIQADVNSQKQCLI